MPSVPKYCHNCGEPYPWQAAAIDNMREILAESDLNREEQNELALAMQEIVSDSPKAEAASLKVKRLAQGLGKPVYDVFVKVAADVISEAWKKQLFGG